MCIRDRGPTEGCLCNAAQVGCQDHFPLDLRRQRRQGVPRRHRLRGQRVQPRSGDSPCLLYTSIAYELAPGESRKLTLSWGELDWGGVLPAGTYCVAQGGLLGEQQVTVSVTFAIK